MVKANFRGRRRAEHRLRGGLLLLTAAAALPGVWATFWPRSFFDDFPGLGFAWVNLYPPFNEHLVRDVGTFYLAFAVLFAITTRLMGKRLTRIALISWLFFAVPHLIFHLTHLEGLEGSDAVGQSLSLALLVLVPLALLTQVRKAERRGVSF